MEILKHLSPHFGNATCNRISYECSVTKVAWPSYKSCFPSRIQDALDGGVRETHNASVEDNTPVIW